MQPASVLAGQRRICDAGRKVERHPKDGSTGDRKTTETKIPTLLLKAGWGTYHRTADSVSNKLVEPI